MKKTWLRPSWYALLTVAIFHLPAQAQLLETLPPDLCTLNESRIPVMLVGSYHMSNPGMDSFNLEADDVSTPKRQHELEELVARLSEFAPTRVAIEAPWGDSTATDRYNSYANGALELRRSEEEQVGFRLANSMGHDTVYPVDVRMMLDDEKLGPVIDQNPEFQKKMQDLQKIGGEVIQQMGTWLSEGTIGDMLYQMNRPEVLRQAHWPYVWILAPIAAGDEYPGADMVGTWYVRNLRIFANITRISGPGDRVFVVYGQGHIPILQQLFRDSPDFCLEDPLPYLAERD